MEDGIIRKRILRLKSGVREEIDDAVAVEKKLNISLNGKLIASLYCTPLMIRELATGFVMTEGIAKALCLERMSITYGDEISVDVPADENENAGPSTKTSGCAGGLSFEKKAVTKAGSLSIKRDALLKLFAYLRRQPPVMPQNIVL